MKGKEDTDGHGTERERRDLKKPNFRLGNFYNISLPQSVRYNYIEEFRRLLGFDPHLRIVIIPAQDYPRCYPRHEFLPFLCGSGIGQVKIKHPGTTRLRFGRAGTVMYDCSIVTRVLRPSPDICMSHKVHTIRADRGPSNSREFL